MSVASCAYQCAWVADLGVSFTASLLGEGGDLFQRYGGTPSDPTDVVPDWTNATIKPFIRILLMESDPDVTAADLADYVSDVDTKWYVDGLLLKFDSSGVSIEGAAGECTDFGGCFRKLTAATGANHNANAPFGGLEIRKDLVGPSKGQNISIRCVVGLTVNGKAINVQGETTIRIVKSVGSSSFCSIYCGNDDSFVLDNNNTSVKCMVRAWRGSTEVTSFTRKWYLMEQGQWVQKATTNDFTVSQDDIATFGDVKVECYETGATKPFASDIQTIADTTDSLILAPNPNPADGQFRQTGGPDKITFTPKVVDSDGNQRTVLGYWFAVYDSAGNPQVIGTNNAQRVYINEGGSFDLPKSIASGINEGPVVNISAEN